MEQLGNFINYAFLIPSLMIFAACIYYLTRKITPQDILLLIGSFIGLLSSAFHRIGITYLTMRGMAFEELQEILNPLAAVALAGSVLFAIGLLLLVVDASKIKKF